MSQSLKNTLPSSWYLDDEQFQRELKAIWLREWLFVGHVSEWPESGSFKVVSIGVQQLIITRDRQRQFHAFHNTCRHRGSRLCREHNGKFRGGRIVCPYHAWAYGLDGDLLAAPRMNEVEGFENSDHGLYTVAVSEVDGFVFINAGLPRGSAIDESVTEELKLLQAWPLTGLAITHQESHEIACNWKVFWENFLECYHCPGIHPDLCRLVPVYSQAANSLDELPEEHEWLKEGREERLREGAVTWSKDGTTQLPWFEGLGEVEKTAGMTFATTVPSAYMVGHVDYFRTVQILPVNASTTRLTVSWYVHADVLASDEHNLADLPNFARQVVMEDAAVAELNQQGLSCSVHEQGVLSPAEGDVGLFQDWVRERVSAK